MSRVTNILAAPEPAFFNALDLQVEAYNRAFKERGLVEFKNPDHYKELTLEIYKHHYGKKGSLIMSELVGLPETSDEVKALVGLKEKHFKSLIESPGDLIEIMPGAIEFMDESFLKGSVLQFVTSGQPYVIEGLKKYAGVQEKVGPAITGADVTYGKPNPGLYLKALFDASLKSKDFSIANCLAVDGTLHGVKSATRAGMDNIIAVIGDQPRDIFEESLKNTERYWIIESLEELFPKKFYEIIEGSKI